MEQTYPIVIDGALVGQLKVTDHGTMTEFEARCKLLPGIVRISVYGMQKEAVLGVLAPEGEQLCLKKRFSRSAMREFPEIIEAVERSGLLQQRCEIAAMEEQQEESRECEEPIPEAVDDILWYATPEGELVSFDGKDNYIAFPENSPAIAEGMGEYRSIEGKRYYVQKLPRGAVISD